jgi:hypothetical protein
MQNSISALEARPRRGRSSIRINQAVIVSATVLGFYQSVCANVQKVRIPCLQGLGRGEIEFLDFPFRLKKSLK